MQNGIIYHETPCIITTYKIVITRLSRNYMYDTLNSNYSLPGILCGNKTNHPISSNSHPSATANIAIHFLKIGGLGVATKPTGICHII